MITREQALEISRLSSRNAMRRVRYNAIKNGFGGSNETLVNAERLVRSSKSEFDRYLDSLTREPQFDNKGEAL